MILSGQQLRDVYEALVLPMGHPDPIGYMTRAFFFSGGDPDYYGGDGKVGFMPIEPERATELTGNGEVATLQNNVSTTVVIDLMYFQQYGTVNDMMVAFHFGEDMISPDGNYTGELGEFIETVNELRLSMKDIVSPRRATLKDVIKMLKDQLERKNKPSKGMMEVVERILEEK